MKKEKEEYKMKITPLAEKYAALIKTISVPPKPERFIGRVASWNNQRRFGFIENPNPNGTDIFTHVSGLRERQRLFSGEIVEYTLSANAKGNIAVDVAVIESKAQPITLSNKEEQNEPDTDNFNR